MGYAIIGEREYKKAGGFKKAVGARIKRYRKQLVLANIDFKETIIPPGVLELPEALILKLPEDVMYLFKIEQGATIFTWEG